jgi:hypothetical protein
MNIAVAAGIFALAGVALGAVLGLVTNAVIERWRHSYIRKDARTDRYAATLREALTAYTEFVLAWAEPANKVANGGTVDMLDPAIVAGPPAQTHQRLAAVNERIHIESIRYRLDQLVGRVVMSVAEGKVTSATIAAHEALGTQVAADIGVELRKLEAQ